MTSSTGNKMQQNEKAAAAAEEDELADIQELFQFYDTKGDGHIWADQLGDCLRAIGLCPTQAQLTQLHSAVQQPQGGGEEQQQQQQQRISAEQFLPMLHAIRKQGAKDRNELELATFLENLDRDGSGCVSLADLRHFLTSFGEPLSEEEFDVLLAAVVAGPAISRERRDEGRLGIDELVNTLLGNKGAE